MELFHVDPAGTLDPGTYVELLGPEAVAPDGQDAARIAERFPDGLSRYGSECAFADLTTTDFPAAIVREWMFEFYRQSNYSEYIPSRFQTLFAYENPGSAKQHARQTFGPGTYEIYRVEAADPSGPYYTGFFEGGTIPEMMAFARSYWEEVPHQRGEREYLIELPVEIGEWIDTVEVR